MASDRSPRAIFWDNDGVLVDTEHLYFEATRQILASVDVPLSESDYVELFLRQSRGAWHLAEARGIPADEIERLRQARNALYASFLRQPARVLPGVADVLAALHGTCVMGVVTSSHRDHFELIHQHTGLLQYFDFALTSGDYARSKPEPDPYLRAIERSGIAADECIAVEDSERGLEAATRAGIRCIVVPTPLTRECRFAAAHRIIGSVTELPELLG